MKPGYGQRPAARFELATSGIRPGALPTELRRLGGTVGGVKTKYDGAILYPTDGGGSLLGEPAWAIRKAEAAGVIYHCEAEDGSCGHGVHTSEPGPSGFWHYCEAKTDADYDAVTEERNDRG